MKKGRVGLSFLVIFVCLLIIPLLSFAEGLDSDFDWNIINGSNIKIYNDSDQVNISGTIAAGASDPEAASITTITNIDDASFNISSTIDFTNTSSSFSNADDYVDLAYRIEESGDALFDAVCGVYFVDTSAYIWLAVENDTDGYGLSRESVITGDGSTISSDAFNFTYDSDTGALNCSIVEDTGGLFYINDTAPGSFDLADGYKFKIRSQMEDFESGTYGGDVVVNFSNLNYTAIIGAIDNAPNITLNLPADGYYNDLATTETIDFNCSATDDQKLKNISLYLTDETNSSWAFNQSTDIIGTMNGSQWSVPLGLGNYTWGCLVHDNNSQGNWSVNSLFMNWSTNLYAFTEDFDSALSPDNWTITNGTYIKINPDQINQRVNFSGSVSAVVDGDFAILDTFKNVSGSSFTVSVLVNVTNTSSTLGVNDSAAINFGALDDAFDSEALCLLSYNETGSFIFRASGNSSNATVSADENTLTMTYNSTDNVTTCYYGGESFTTNITQVDDTFAIGITGGLEDVADSVPVTGSFTAYFDDVNFTYGIFPVIDNSPNITMNAPIANYYNEADLTELVTFNCSTIDDQGLTNMSLYITNKYNNSQTVSNTTVLTGTSNSSQWNLTLAVGDYGWACDAYDNNDQRNLSNDRYFSLNYSVSGNLEEFTDDFASGINLSEYYVVESDNGTIQEDGETVLINDSVVGLSSPQFTHLDTYKNLTNNSFNASVYINLTNTTLSATGHYGVAAGIKAINTLSWSNSVGCSVDYIVGQSTPLLAVYNNSMIASPAFVAITTSAGFLNMTYDNRTGIINCTMDGEYVSGTTSLFEVGNNLATDMFIFNANSVAPTVVGNVSFDNFGYNFAASSILDNGPNITMNLPTANYYNDSQSEVNVTFNCSTIDDQGLTNMSLYITNKYNNSQTVSNTTVLTGTSNSSQWNLTLSAGNYAWACDAYDNGSQRNLSNDRYFSLNYSVSGNLTNFTDNFDNGINLSEYYLVESDNGSIQEYGNLILINDTDTEIIDADLILTYLNTYKNLTNESFNASVYVNLTNTTGTATNSYAITAGIKLINTSDVNKSMGCSVAYLDGQTTPMLVLFNASINDTYASSAITTSEGFLNLTYTASTGMFNCTMDGVSLANTSSYFAEGYNLALDTYMFRNGGAAPTSEVNTTFENYTFNTTYVDNFPNITMNSPIANYYNDTTSTVNLTFNCSTTDDQGLTNMSLYITDSSNSSQSISNTSTIIGASNSSQWNLTLAVGDYGWACDAYDNGNQRNLSNDRYFSLNYTAPATSSPGGSSGGGSGYGGDFSKDGLIIEEAEKEVVEDTKVVKVDKKETISINVEDGVVTETGKNVFERNPALLVPAALLVFAGGALGFSRILRIRRKRRLNHRPFK
jgi:hypothetical protein